jgi:hypothetical protein
MRGYVWHDGLICYCLEYGRRKIAEYLRTVGRADGPAQVKRRREAGTGMGAAGTRLATEICGQLNPPKFRMTSCEY